MADNDIFALLSCMKAIRNEATGCPWATVQTHQSLVKNTIEEAYEVGDAVARGDMQDLKLELGDLILQVLFYSDIAEESGAFTFSDVLQALHEKLVLRHPHVFADEPVESLEQQQGHWERIKSEQRASSSVLDDIPKSLPALMQAQKIQKRVASVGFDWPTIDGSLDKLEEETQELKEALASQSQEAITDELGDVFFTLVNLARYLKRDAESVLKQANNKFEKRFRALELLVNSQGKTVQTQSLSELEAHWQSVKKNA